MPRLGLVVLELVQRVIHVMVRLFAIVRDRAGVSSFTLELPDESTIAVAERILLDRYPGLATYLPQCAFALNRAYASRDSILHDGDEVAVLPPVSGGNAT